MMIFHVRLEVLGQLGDARRNDGHLHLGRARVGLVGAVLLDEFSFLFAKNHGKKPFRLTPGKEVGAVCASPRTGPGDNTANSAAAGVYARAAWGQCGRDGAPRASSYRSTSTRDACDAAGESALQSSREAARWTNPMNQCLTPAPPLNRFRVPPSFLPCPTPALTWRHRSLGDRPMAGHQTLTLAIKVRILVPQRST